MCRGGGRLRSAADPEEVRALLQVHKLEMTDEELAAILRDLFLEEAVLFPGITESGRAAAKIQRAAASEFPCAPPPQVTSTCRCPARKAFVFTDRPQAIRAPGL